MDTPFSSSGAMSRAHYALVRKVETATPQAADQILLAELQTIESQLSRSTLTLKQCKEFLVLLLYCSMAMRPGVHVDLEFALPHAINLAEAGPTIQDKRTGYLFCSEVMPAEHELQLMLVNTIRKDLESPTISRICLALDTLILSPSRDVIPAVQTRLRDLLSHNSSDVKRRALFAFSRLSVYDSDLLRDIANKVRTRLGDTDPSVSSAAFTLSHSLLKAKQLPRDKYHLLISGLFDVTWSRPPHPSESRLLVQIIEAIAGLGPSRHDLEVITDVVHHYASKNIPAYVIILQCFRAVSVSSTELLVEVQASTGVSLIKEIRHLLTVQNPNALYVFMSCLSSVDPRLWAGTAPEIPSVLEEWEVERVMKALDCEDKMIRKQTLRTLWRVDHNIVESYYTRALRGEIPISSVYATQDHLPRVLEIMDVICGEDGEAYALQLREALQATEDGGDLNKRPVLQEAVEEILIRIHASDSTWRSACIGVLFSSVADKETEIGPTLVVILTALFCEYLELSPLSPVELVRGIADRICSYSPSLQDACLVTMLRISAACDEVPSEALEIVKGLQGRSGRHLSRRCAQFIALSQSKETLSNIVASTRSSSLPDFVVALEGYQAEAEKQTIASRPDSLVPTSSTTKPRTPEPSPSRASPSPSKLRYTAYETPRLTEKLRRKSSSISRHSDDGSSQGRPYKDTLEMTISPGALSLAAQNSDLHSAKSSSPRMLNMSPIPLVQILDEEPPKGMMTADLIALDSPFMSEPMNHASITSSIMDPDFEITWNSLDSGIARGWCEASIDTVLRRLQRSQRRLRVTERDQAPFEGDLKVLIEPESPDQWSKKGLAAIRLKESDDDSCLWWLRCEDQELQNILKASLQ